MLGASTTFSGKLFHKFAIHKLKKICLMLVLDNFVLIANLCPRVFDSLSSNSEFVQVTSYKLCNILQVSIIEPRNHLYANIGRFNFSNLS